MHCTANSGHNIQGFCAPEIASKRKSTVSGMQPRVKAHAQDRPTTVRGMTLVNFVCCTTVSLKLAAGLVWCGLVCPCLVCSGLAWLGLCVCVRGHVRECGCARASRCTRNWHYRTEAGTQLKTSCWRTRPPPKRTNEAPTYHAVIEFAFAAPHWGGEGARSRNRPGAKPVC